MNENKNAETKCHKNHVGAKTSDIRAGSNNTSFYNNTLLDRDIAKDMCITTVPLQAGTIILKTSVAHLWRGRPLDLRVNQLLG